MIGGPEAFGRLTPLFHVGDVAREPGEAESANIVSSPIESHQLPVATPEDHRVRVDVPVGDLPV
jgi:hypothetical protein